MLRGLIVGILAVAAPAAGFAGSAAGGPPAGLGQLELSYTGTTTNWTQAPGRAEQATYDPCDPPASLVGMGVYVFNQLNPITDPVSTFQLGRAWNVSVYPTDQIPGPPAPDSTMQVADTRFGTTNDAYIGESTTCAAQANGLRYPSLTRRTVRRARTAARVSCPGNRSVLSGGGQVTGPHASQRLVASSPFDSDDPGSKSDDGWRVAVDNLSKKRRKLTVFAVCSTTKGFRYASSGFRSKRRTRKHVATDCPAGTYIVGGGVTHSARFAKATLVATRPVDLVGTGTWITEVDNLSRKRASGRSFAICHA